jgi:hypothetical protein
MESVVANGERFGPLLQVVRQANPLVFERRDHRLGNLQGARRVIVLEEHTDLACGWLHPDTNDIVE